MKVTLKIYKKKIKKITIHQRNLQVLMIEVYKIINVYAPPIMDNFFIFRENKHNFRNFQIITKKKQNYYKKRERYASETIFYRIPLLWVNLPE